MKHALLYVYACPIASVIICVTQVIYFIAFNIFDVK